MAKNGKVKVVLIREGVRELLRSQEMAASVMSAATAYLSRLPEGYEITEQPYTGKNRVNVAIYPGTASAEQDNLEHNTMLRNL